MKHKLHRRLRFLLGLSCGLCSAGYAADEPGEPAGELTLAQAVALAEERHPELQAARLEAQAAESRLTQATARPNPALSFGAENFGGKGEQKGFGAAEYTAQIEQTLELGGKRSRRTRVALTEKRLADLELEARRLDLRAETSRRFVGVLGAQTQANLVKETMALMESFVKTVTTRVEAGKVPPMELEKARVLLAQQRIALDQALRDLGTARIQLAAQWGSVRPIFECVAGDLLALPVIPPLSALRSRLPGHPDVARWAIEMERSQAVLEQARGERMPDLTLAAGLRRSSETDSDTWVAGVSLPLPLFDRNQGGIREAELLLAKARQQRRAAEVKAAADLTTAHQELVSAVHRALFVKDDILPRSKAVFDAVQSGYTQGKYPYQEVIEARRTLVESQAEYMDAMLSAHTVMAELERIVGGQLPIQKRD